MRSSTVQAAAAEASVREAVVNALVPRGATVVQNVPGALSLKLGSMVKTALLGALISGEKWPIEISLGLRSEEPGTVAHITVSGASSMMGGGIGMLMNKGAKAEQLWLDRTAAAVQGAGFTAEAPTSATTAAPAGAAPASGPVTLTGNCTKCSAPLAGGARFCVECGQPVAQPATCPACGTLAAGKFCGNCGSRLEEQTKPPTKKRAPRKRAAKKASPSTPTTS